MRINHRSKLAYVVIIINLTCRIDKQFENMPTDCTRMSDVVICYYFLSVDFLSSNYC